MKEKLNPVHSIRHIKLSAIEQFVWNDAGKAYVSWTAARNVPFSKATISALQDPGKTSAGKRWTVKVNGQLTQEVKDFEPGILLIKVESGETLIIGDQEHPAEVFLPESFMLKTFEISHQSWHKPFKLTI